jgi:dipeptidyl aminopeptidase/acylaminoacyl peptidase
MNIILSRTAVALAALALSTFAAAQKKPGDYKVEDFFRRAEFTNMQLSPDGQRLAAGVPRKGRTNVVVIDLDKKTRNVITDFSDYDAVEYFWVSNDRLCVRIADGKAVTGEFNVRGTVCVDHDGDNIRDFSRFGRGFNFVGLTYDGSGEVLVQMIERSAESLDVYRLNTRTGRSRLVTQDSPGDVRNWVLDRDSVPRVAVSRPKRKDSSSPEVQTVWYRDGENAKWEKLWSFETLGPFPSAERYVPIAFDFDNTTLYVASDAGRDKAAIYAYDTKARKMGEMLFQHPTIDLEGGLVFSRTQKKLLGIKYSADMPGVAWVDETLARLQKAIDTALPKTNNNIQLPALTDKRALVFASSDVDPGTYYLLDRTKPAVEPIARTREWLDPALMAERRFIKYKARDGLEIPAWVTVPRGGGKNLPLIVNIHGGPWLRIYHGIAWNPPEAQFFASRGYVVLEPEPRGSTGFGRKHYLSSFKQWGQAMQDDITDGALALVNEGLVDKGRMCLYGGSYGGYATAMGLAKDPDLWKCGAPFVAVTDLFTFQNVPYSDMSRDTDFFETDFKKMVGDSRADKDMFTRNSPALQAEKIKAPVFITMGSADIRVPQVHGDSFVSALRSAGKKPEYIVYRGEGHGYNKDENVFDFYRRLEKFFAENLKP